MDGAPGDCQGVGTWAVVGDGQEGVGLSAGEEETEVMFGIGNAGSCYEGPPIWPENGLQLEVLPASLRRADWRPGLGTIMKIASYHRNGDGEIDSITVMYEAGPVFELSDRREVYK